MSRVTLRDTVHIPLKGDYFIDCIFNDEILGGRRTWKEDGFEFNETVYFHKDKLKLPGVVKVKKEKINGSDQGSTSGSSLYSTC